MPRLDRRALAGAMRSPDGSAIRREEAATLNHVMARLSADHRRVLELRYWSGMSFVDMAPLLGRSPDAVRKLWYRAVEQTPGGVGRGRCSTLKPRRQGDASAPARPASR